MILVRNVFRLKYGQARPAIAAWKEAEQLMKRVRPQEKMRMLTDLVGPAYTMVLESTYANLAEFEEAGRAIMGNDEWRQWYGTFVPFVESGYREIFNVLE